MSDAVSSEEQVGTQTTNGEATVCLNSDWSREQLTHGSRVLLSSSSKDFSVAPALWGRPGHLTETQADVYVSQEQEHENDRFRPEPVVVLVSCTLFVICCLLFRSVFVLRFCYDCDMYRTQGRKSLYIPVGSLLLCVGGKRRIQPRT